MLHDVLVVGLALFARERLRLGDQLVGVQLGPRLLIGPAAPVLEVELQRFDVRRSAMIEYIAFHVPQVCASATLRFVVIHH